MRTASSPFHELDALGTQRVTRPPKAIAYQLTSYVQPAATTPSNYAHVIVRGIDQTQSAAPVGGAGTEHWLCEWDYLESPQLYGTWIPMPNNVAALAILIGGNAGCVGVVLRGSISWLLED